MSLRSRHLGDIDYVPGHAHEWQLTCGVAGNREAPLGVDIAPEEILTQAILELTDVAIDYLPQFDERVRQKIAEETQRSASALAPMYADAVEADKSDRMSPSVFAADLLVESVTIMPAASGPDATKVTIVYATRAGFVANQFIATARERSGLTFSTSQSHAESVF